jgi:16S rRNA (cytosine967-C5)-methyltransferase
MRLPWPGHGGPVHWRVSPPKRSFDRSRGGASPRTGTPARAAALARLARQAERFPRLDFEPLETAGLDDRDAALAEAICDAVVRRWLTLECVLGVFLDRPMVRLDPPIRAALLGGAAQLLLMDRIPPHAAINESVEWTRHVEGVRPAGLVNAVLRQVAQARCEPSRPGDRPVTPHDWHQRRDAIPLSDGTLLTLAGAILSSDPLERLCESTSHPRRLLERWVESLGFAAAAGVALHDVSRPPVVLNTRHATGPLEPAADFEAHDEPGAAVFRGSRRGLVELLGARDDVWVQDAGSAAAVEQLAHLRPARIIDLCAGLGTKTRQLLLTFPGARVIASDPDPGALAELRVLSRRHARLDAAEPGELGKEAPADLVLADVPCSNTGALARRPEARYRFDARQLTRLVETQRRIVEKSASLLGAGGVLAYSTCSLEREENEAQVEWACGAPGFAQTAMGGALPAGTPLDGPGAYRDGWFAGVLERRGR